MNAGADLRDETNRLIAYHSEISKAMTAERTSLESKLIPVTAYILVAACEAWHRWPDMVRAIDAAMPAEEIGARARRPGCRVNAVHLWSAANIFLVGRKFLTMFQLTADDAERVHAVLDFWQRAASAFRADGHRQAWDAGFSIPSYADDIVQALAAGAAPVDDEERARIKRFNALLTSYLFLLYFDTRVGSGDSGPYELGDGRVLLVRDFYELGRTHFWWSDVAGGVPYRNLTAAMILEGVDVKVNDWGTSITTPEDYLDHLVAYGLFTTDIVGGALRSVDLNELPAIGTAVKRTQAQHYRNVAAMDRDEKIRCGAYVYFTFLRPFAEIAGIADDLDWTVPRDTQGPLYTMLAAIDGTNSAPEEDVYYEPLA